MQRAFGCCDKLQKYWEYHQYKHGRTVKFQGCNRFFCDKGCNWESTLTCGESKCFLLKCWVNKLLAFLVSNHRAGGFQAKQICLWSHQSSHRGAKKNLPHWDISTLVPSFGFQREGGSTLATFMNYHRSYIQFFPPIWRSIKHPQGSPGFVIWSFWKPISRGLSLRITLWLFNIAMV